MGLQAISERKVRKAVAKTGLPIFRAMRHSNDLWFGWVCEGDGHWHVEINPKDWDWEYAPGCGFSSCSTGEHGPRMLPADSSIVEEHERRESERQTRREFNEAHFQETARIWAEVTRKQFGLESEEPPK